MTFDMFHVSYSLPVPFLIHDIIWFVIIRVTRRVSLVEQELLTLLVHLSSPPVFSVVCVARSLVLCVVFCRLLFVLLSF